MDILAAISAVTVRRVCKGGNSRFYERKIVTSTIVKDQRLQQKGKSVK